MENTKKPQIYESPDGGLTVYARDFGDPHSSRVQITFMDSPKMIYDECTGWEQVSTGTSSPDLTGYEKDSWYCETTAIGGGTTAIGGGTVQIKKNTYIVDNDLCDEHPELKSKWEEFSKLQEHYKAWELLNKK